MTELLIRRPAVAGVAREVLAAARALGDLAVGTVGNVSARTADGLLITPTRMDFAAMTDDDLVLLSFDEVLLAGHRRPSLESRLHAGIYVARPDVGAVVHTHSVHATAWSHLGRPLEPEIEEAAYYGIGPVRTSAPAPAGSPELAERAVEALGASLAVLLGGHGVVAVGPRCEDALVVARVVERHARIAWLLRGGA